MQDQSSGVDYDAMGQLVINGIVGNGLAIIIRQQIATVRIDVAWNVEYR